MQSEIRILSREDANNFWQLRLRALKEEPESFGASYEESLQLPEAEIESRLLSSESKFVLGAFAPDLVGMVGFIRQHGIKTQHKAFIWGVYVMPELRGHGIGKALLSEVISRASKLSGLEYLTLTVSANKESAKKLYLSLGFRSYGVESRALKIGNTYIDEELMDLHLIKA